MSARRFTRLRVIAVTAMTALVGAAVIASPVAAGTKPKSGGSVTFVQQSDPRSLDPTVLFAASSAVGVQMFFNVYGALLVEEKGKVKPLLAESFKTTDGGTTWVLKLRPDLQFSDGTPFDADAVKFNWDRIRDPANQSPGLLAFSNVDTYTVDDPQTITVKLKSPNTQLPYSFTGAASYIGSPTAIQAKGADFGNAPVGGGPFLLEEWIRGDHATYVANPDYVDAKKVKLDEVIIRPVADELQKQNAFTTDTAQIVWTGQEPTVDAAKQAGGKVTSVPLVGNISVMYNTQAAPFNDPAVMRAFTQAMDRNTIAKSIWGDESAPAGLVSTTSSIYDSKAKYPKHNLAAAQKVIDEYVAANGPITVGILYSAGNQAILDSATTFKQQLEQLDGVTVNVEAIDQAALTTRWRSGDWTMTFNALSGTAPDPTVYNTFHSTGALNFGKYSNPEVDAALDATRTTTDPKAVEAAYADFQQAVTADGYYPPFHNSHYYLLSQPEVKTKYFADAAPRFDLISVKAT